VNKDEILEIKTGKIFGEGFCRYYKIKSLKEN
jgi:hypothetical protein